MASIEKFAVFLLTMSSMLQSFECETRYFVKMLTNTTDPLSKLMGNYPSSIIDDRRMKGNDSKINRAVNHPDKSRSSFRIDDETMIRESLKDNLERRNSFIESSTFDPDVLNKFLDDYANKIKSTTERNFNFPFRIGKPDKEKFHDKIDVRPIITSLENDKKAEFNKTTVTLINSTIETSGLNQQDLNDTIKRNKYFGAHVNDDRNGWVTLEAIPWSKSKISKWQASSSSQRPWPDMKVWEKPNGGKPWPSEHPSRPAYINNEPWPEIPKPLRQEYQSGRPPTRPQSTTRPSYFEDNFDHNPNQAQKWPPERPQSSWDKFPSMDTYKPNVEIITDDRPSNFPTSWDKYNHAMSNANKHHSYTDRDRYPSNYDHNNNNHHHHHHNEDTNEDWRDVNNYPSKFEHYKDRPSNFGRPTNDHQSVHNARPQHLSHYQYTPEHPPNHPSSGDGQWVLLSTNGGYSKSRQRSIKLEDIKPDDHMIKINTTIPARTTRQDNDEKVAMMTSKRQVRLTVLPSINGTNTTTSHGGLLEVEKTFKTVEQSRKEYEDSKITSPKPFIVNNRPIRNTVIRRPSNSAILAAVGAGMVPATMAMMIPIMLGRKKRSPQISTIRQDISGNWTYDTKFSTTRGEFVKKLRKSSAF